MRFAARCGLAVVFALFGGVAAAAPYYVTLDYHSVGGQDTGDGTSEVFEIWEIGSRVESGQLQFTVLLNMPKAGAYDVDTYSPTTPTLLTLGDLWISIGTRNPFASGPGITRYAVALTTHANVVQQRYAGTWPQVTEGRLYTSPAAALGTLENYQQKILADPNKAWLTPDDLDGNNQKNSYMTMIMNYASEITGHSGVQWTDDGQYSNGNNMVQMYRIDGYVDLSALPGLTPGTDYCLFVASECGNDGAMTAPPIPEPATLWLLGAALAAARLIPRPKSR